MGEPSASTDERPMSLERVIFFSDAVFAIVITLLVLPIAAEGQLPQVYGGLAQQVWAMRPKILSFAISFLVIGQFWIAHHRMFDYVRRADQRLLWLNLVGLLTVSFLPFPSALLGAHNPPTDHFAVVFYAASMTIASLALTVTWLHALRAGLVDQTLDRHTARYFTTRTLLTSALFLVSVGAGFFFGYPAAILFWLVLLPAARILLARRHRRRQPLARHDRVSALLVRSIPIGLPDRVQSLCATVSMREAVGEDRRQD
jgi:uncharacterized membrane protein